MQKKGGRVQNLVDKDAKRPVVDRLAMALREYTQIVVVFEFNTAQALCGRLIKMEKEKQKGNPLIKHSFYFDCHVAAIYLVEQDLGRNVFRRSAQRPRAVLDVFGETEIGDAHVAIAGRA